MIETSVNEASISLVSCATKKVVNDDAALSSQSSCVVGISPAQSSRDDSVAETATNSSVEIYDPDNDSDIDDLPIFKTARSVASTESKSEREEIELPAQLAVQDQKKFLGGESVNDDEDDDDDDGDDGKVVRPDPSVYSRPGLIPIPSASLIASGIISPSVSPGTYMKGSQRSDFSIAATFTAESIVAREAVDAVMSSFDAGSFASKGERREGAERGGHSPNGYRHDYKGADYSETRGDGKEEACFIDNNGGNGRANRAHFFFECDDE